MVMSSALVSLLTVAVLLSAARVSPSPSSVDIVPQQLHIALGYTPTTIVVQWVTWASPTSASVHYGLTPSSLTLTSPSSFHVFTDGDRAQWNRTVHAASLTKLIPDRTYFYQVSTTNSTSTLTSALHSFHTLSATAGTGSDSPIRIGMIGDYGLVNGDQTHQSLARLTNAGGLDLLVHVGQSGSEAETLSDGVSE